MTFVRTLNAIIDDVNEQTGGTVYKHGDSVLECLNNIIGTEAGYRFEKTDDAVEFLVRTYLGIGTESDVEPEPIEDEPIEDIGD